MIFFFNFNYLSWRHLKLKAMKVRLSFIAFSSLIVECQNPRNFLLSLPSLLLYHPCLMKGFIILIRGIARHWILREQKFNSSLFFSTLNYRRCLDCFQQMWYCYLNFFIRMYAIGILSSFYYYYLLILKDRGVITIPYLLIILMGLWILASSVCFYFYLIFKASCRNLFSKRESMQFIISFIYFL